MLKIGIAIILVRDVMTGDVTDDNVNENKQDIV